MRRPKVQFNRDKVRYGRIVESSAGLGLCPGGEEKLKIKTPCVMSLAGHEKHEEETKGQDIQVVRRARSEGCKYNTGRQCLVGLCR